MFYTQGYKSAMEKCEDEASRLTSQLKDFKESNSKLRTYIAQVQESEHAREQWKVEKMEMIAAISVRFSRLIFCT